MKYNFYSLKSIKVFYHISTSEIVTVSFLFKNKNTMLLCGVLQKDIEARIRKELSVEPIDPVLARVFIAVTRHHDHGNFYKGNI